MNSYVDLLRTPGVARIIAAQLTARAPGYAAIDMMAEYKFTPDLFGQLNVSNVANRTYGDQLYPGFSTLGVGRTVVASLSYRY